MGQYVYGALVLIAAVVSAALAFYAWRRRGKPGVVAFAGLMLAVALWALVGGLRSLSDSPSATRFWFNAMFLSASIVPVAYLVFVIQYTGRERWLGRWKLIAMFIITIITQIMVWTNDAHKLFYRELAAINWAESNPGPWFWVHLVYGYGLLAWGVLLILLTIMRSHALYRRQAVVLLVGTFPPLVVNVLGTFGWMKTDPSAMPLSFTFTGMVFAWDLFRYRLFDVVPVARDTLIDSMSDGMLVLDAHDRIVDLNPAMEMILGLQAGQAVGRPREAVLQNLPEQVGRFLDASTARAEITTTQDGVLRHYDLRVSPLSSRRGQLTGHLIVMHDVTERKRTEEALQLSNLELRERNEELDAFAHTVAHDLKNPLSTLVGYSTLLREQREEITEEFLCFGLEVIERNGIKMSAIIDELLLLASVRQAEDVALEPVDMSAIVADVQVRLAGLIQEHQAEIVAPERWPTALGRSQWIEEVWINYVSNAIKYGGRPPQVELGGTEQADGAVRFWVRDNGDGLAVEAQSRLFTPFTRLSQVQVEGHGLGLSIVRRIVEKMHGQVGVESQGVPGKGCVFSFTLPST
ncbi:MAG: PAS domain S-box protein [Anaerolineae bacterium]|nr:PAS domain S-box protein [Anaerolineae bacterium]